MAKTTITVRVSEDRLDKVDEAADEAGVSRSEYIRERLREKDEIETLEAKVERLSERLESREERIDTLEEQLARRSQIEERVDEVALQVREQRETSNAPFWVRWRRWWRNER